MNQRDPGGWKHILFSKYKVGNNGWMTESADSRLILVAWYNKTKVDFCKHTCCRVRNKKKDSFPDTSVAGKPISRSLPPLGHYRKHTMEGASITIKP